MARTCTVVSVPLLLLFASLALAQTSKYSWNYLTIINSLCKASTRSFALPLLSSYFALFSQCKAVRFEVIFNRDLLLRGFLILRGLYPKVGLGLSKTELSVGSRA